MLTATLIKVLLWLLALPATPQATAQTAQRGATRNPHGPITMACENCHTLTSWKPIRNIPEFDHNTARYPLRGMHEKVQCQQCHTKLVFTSVSTKCADCHADIHRRQLGANCEQCHTVRGWQVSVQAIRQHQNRFPLIGAHAALDCESCHKGGASGRFTGLPTDCAACHFGAYQQAKIPDHRALGFPMTCQSCHAMDAWQGAKFDHAQFTGFLLTGAHARLKCAACHVGGRFKATPANCYGCHAKDFNATRNPDHAGAGFPQDCSRCHTTATWTGARFDHNALTKFPLTGAHASASCQQCHAGGKFSGTPNDCASCHMSDFQKTTNPNHVAANFLTNCSACHTTSSWSGAKFDHSRTRFPLTGAHLAQDCSTCHVGGKYTSLDAACVSCHLTNYNNTKNPNHKAGGFPQECAVCHTTTAWSPASFEHNRTRFPLTGAHVNVNCQQCHTNGRYTGTPNDCASCHLTNYNNTRNPNHKAAGFPTNCALCHTTSAWAGARFDHNTFTKFPLTGAHARASCQQCHVNGRFAGTPKDCASCHLTDYNNTRNPNHQAAGFPTDCSICHSTAQWSGAKFDHSRTRFPLTGAHLTQGCASCHVGGRYSGLSTACVSCHLANYNNTQNPNHRAAGFPQECAVCHTTSAWTPATFDHSRTPFPLTGAHVRVACASCHIGGRYAGTPNDCYSCHKKEFTGVTNPNHAAAGFPTDCRQCHTTTTWTGARFNHTWFPIYSGAHAGKWTTCNECHINPSNFAVFSCVTCHAHEKTLMDQKHRDVRTYVYNSANCYSCHPAGKAN